MKSRKSSTACPYSRFWYCSSAAAYVRATWSTCGAGSPAGIRSDSGAGRLAGAGRGGAGAIDTSAGSTAGEESGRAEEDQGRPGASHDAATVAASVPKVKKAGGEPAIGGGLSEEDHLDRAARLDRRVRRDDRQAVGE